MPRTFAEWILFVLLASSVSLFLIPRLPWFIGLMLLLVFALLAIVCYDEVSANPPSVATPTFLGGRCDEVIREGWVFLLPFIETLIVEQITPEEMDIEVKGVRCLLSKDGEKASGGAVTVNVSVVYVPDTTSPASFRKFQDRGRRPKINKILEDMVEEVVRQHGATLTWEELTLGQYTLSALLVEELVGVSDQQVTSENTAKTFLRSALENGVADIHDLGIKIRRLNVTNVEAEGDLKKNAERGAIEKQQRTAEMADVHTAIALAKEIVTEASGRGEKMTLAEALDRVSVLRGRSEETFVRSNNTLLDAAAILRRGAGVPTPSSESKD